MRETPSTEDFQAARIASLEARVIELEVATRTVLAAWAILMRTVLNRK